MSICCISRLANEESHEVDSLMMSDTALYLNCQWISNMSFSADEDEPTSDDDDDTLVGMWGHLFIRFISSITE